MHYLRILVKDVGKIFDASVEIARLARASVDGLKNVIVLYNENRFGWVSGYSLLNILF